MSCVSEDYSPSGRVPGTATTQQVASQQTPKYHVKEYINQRGADGYLKPLKAWFQVFLYNVK